MQEITDKVLFVDFSSLQGENAHLIIAAFEREAGKAKWSQDLIEKILDEMTSSTYEHLWNVVCLYSETPNIT